MDESTSIRKVKCDLCPNTMKVTEAKWVSITIGYKDRISKNCCPLCAQEFRNVLEKYLDNKDKLSFDGGTMLIINDKLIKCPSCGKMVKFYTADTPAVKRTYCPLCLRDYEVIWKEKI